MKLNSILFYLLFITAANAFTVAKAQVNVSDSLALVDLYNSTDGPHWTFNTNWLKGPVNTWIGITVTGTRVTGINLYGKNLNGKLPASIGNLTALVNLSMGSNLLKDTLPASVGNLSMLQVMDFYGNLLKGNIPVAITNLTNLVKLDLSYNSFTGHIPFAIGNLVKLTFLNLISNKLGGEIPYSIGDLVNLTSLYLNSNHFSGSLPVSIGKLVNLQELQIRDNQLSGSIPPVLGKLTNLSSIYLDNNQLSGEIPYSIGNLTQLLDISLQYNQLSGAIPSSLSKDTNLLFIEIFNNQLSGPVPYSFESLTQLQSLILNNNQLSGSIPRSLAYLPKLVYINLSFNQLSGSVPSSFGQQSSLSSLYLSHNSLSGEIPSFINSTNLRNLDLSYNQFTEKDNVNFLKIKKVIAVIGLNNNRFTFNGLEVIAKKYANAYYATQALISAHKTGNTLSVYAGGTLSNNTYTWFKVGQAAGTVITGDSTFQPTKTGKYYAQITNAVATQLTLFSDTINYSMPLQNNNIASSLKTINYKFSVYPNPAKDIINIQTAGTDIITIINNSGKAVLEKSVNKSGEINISSLAGGSYYIQNKTTGEVQKVIIAH